ncbi:MAG: hypoxanthine phosphoribosyltransferase [Eubacteriales bacterium]
MKHRDIERILVSETEIDETVRSIAKQIDTDYSTGGRFCENGREPKLVLLCVLKGSVVFMGELMKRIGLPVEIDFMKVSSYGNSSVSSGSVNIILDLHRKDISELDILIIEDIIDSGRTLSYLVEYLKLKGAHTVRTCTLLDKIDRREVDFRPDYAGRVIPDEFVVGYGLDYAEKYRALPYVGVLKTEIYTKK